MTGDKLNGKQSNLLCLLISSGGELKSIIFRLEDTFLEISWGMWLRLVLYSKSRANFQIWWKMKFENGQNVHYINFIPLNPPFAHSSLGVQPKSTHKNDCRKISNLPIPSHFIILGAKILTRFRLSHEETLNHIVQFWMQNLWSSSIKKTQFQANHCSWSGWTRRWRVWKLWKGQQIYAIDYHYGWGFFIFVFWCHSVSIPRPDRTIQGSAIDVNSWNINPVGGKTIWTCAERLLLHRLWN